MTRHAIAALATTCALVGALPLNGTAKDQNDHNDAVEDAVVQFGQRQPQPVPGPPSHFLDPDDVNIHKGGTVTFIVNSGGHGVAIYPVAKDTTREDIAEDLCQGGTDEADRTGRALVCGAAQAALPYTITDGKNDVVIQVPSNATGQNPRVDDMTDRLIATSGGIPGDGTANPAGAFLTGTNAANAPGNRIQYRFLKTGRYLVICMNRNHLLDDHMFGFVNVVGDDGND